MPSCNPKFNKELRELLEARREEYDTGSYAQINTADWREWGLWVVGKTPHKAIRGSRFHTLLLEYLRESLAPARRELLLYVKENLDPEAWKILTEGKDGLKVPDEVKFNVPILDEAERECLALIIKGIEDGDQWCTENRPHISLPRTKGMLTAAECVRTCNRIFEGSDKYNKCCRCDEGPSKAEALPILKEVLDAQKPLPKKIEFNVPILDEAERGVLKKMIEVISPLQRCGTEGCSNICGQIFPNMNDCKQLPRAERARIFREVLKAQKPLLPPHNVPQLEKEKYEALEKWRGKQPANNCPKSSGDWYESDCLGIFPELNTTVKDGPILCGGQHSCPCHAYDNDAVLTIIDKILAKGPKEEETMCPYTPDKPCSHHKTYPCLGCVDFKPRAGADGEIAVLSDEAYGNGAALDGAMHTVEALTAERDKLREAVENLMEAFAIDDDTAYVPIEAYHRLKSALDSTVKAECPKNNLSSEQRRHMENTVTLLESRHGKAVLLDLDIGKSIAKAVEWIKATLGEKGGPR
jgi:hypothetical protein